MQVQSPRRVQAPFYVRVFKKSTSADFAPQKAQLRIKMNKLTSRQNQLKPARIALQIDSSIGQILGQSKNHQLFSKMQRQIYKNKTISSGAELRTQRLRKKHQFSNPIKSEQKIVHPETVPSFVVEKCLLGLKKHSHTEKSRTIEQSKPNTAKKDNKFNRNNMYITELVNKIKFSQQKSFHQLSHDNLNSQHNSKYAELFRLTQQSRFHMTDKEQQQMQMIYQRQARANMSNRKFNKFIIYGKRQNYCKGNALKAFNFRKMQTKQQFVRSQLEKTKRVIKQQELKPWDITQFNEDQQSNALKLI